MRVPEAEAGPAAAGRRRYDMRRAASWSATAGATSRPASAAGAGATILVDYGYDESHAARARRPRRGRWPRRPTGFWHDLTTRIEANDMKLTDLRTKIFADGAELAGMLALYRQPHIKGFTTNPTLMRKAGITDYRAFAQRGAGGHSRSADLVRGVLRRVRGDGAAGARDRTWGEHVYVKIPVTNTRREPALRSRPPARRTPA